MLRDRYCTAIPFTRFVQDAEANREMWQVMERRARVPEELLDRVRELPGKLYLLVLVEDWCGDAVNTVPPIAALAQAAPNLELRVLGRDTNADLMDAHLTHGSRSIPVVIVLDEEFEEIGWWDPRPTELQAWVRSEGAPMPKEERYKEVRRWYARDRGESTLREIIELLEDAACVAC
jgi:hypothetical protein